MRSLTVYALLPLAALMAATAQGHHSRTYFDLQSELTIQGRVTQVKWRNPHIRYVLERERPNGVKEVWTLEGQTPGGYEQQDWNRDSIKIGDEVSFLVHPNSKNGERPPAKQSGLLNFAVLADGSRLPAEAENEEKADESQPPEAETVFAGSTDFSGNWEYFLVLDEIKLLGSTPPRDWPLTAKGRSQVDNFDINEDPIFDCQEPGLPRMITYLYDRRWERFADRIEIIPEGMPESQVRTIWLDGRAPPADFTPSPVGFSSGRLLDDGSLVVETSGFPAVRWGLETGLDSSAQKRVVEHYALTNGSYTGSRRMAFTVTVEDPVYLSEPVVIKGVYDLVAPREFAPFTCDPEAARAHLEFN